MVRRTLPLLAGDLEARITEQGGRAVALARGRPILDVPVGTAHFTLRWASLHPGLVVGADIASGMVRVASERARSRASNLVVLEADIHHLPFAAASFGSVMCSNGLQVIPGLRPSLRELRRVLHPSGRLFVSLVHLPLGALLPRAAAAKLPTLLRSRASIVAALEGTGLRITSLRRQRLALLLEAAPG